MAQSSAGLGNTERDVKTGVRINTGVMWKMAQPKAAGNRRGGGPRAQRRLSKRRFRGILRGMETKASWQWDETVAINKDFGDRSVVAAYDEGHRRFRDVDGENAAVLTRLDLPPDAVAMDFGCGTGAFARLAARRCRTVYAVDVSAAMLDFVEWKAKEDGLANVVCRRGGFLTYVHDGPPLDAIHSSLALHHLPDFWKQKALERLAGWLKPGGRFHLMDVVFELENRDANVEAWIAQMAAKGGAQVGESVRGHVRREFSTFAWIMEGLLERAGFRIDSAESTGGVLANYYCTKA